MKSLHSTLAAAAFLSVSTVSATEVSLAGMFPGKALVSIDGGDVRTLSIGERTPEGVRFLRISGDAGVFEVDGRQRTLRVGQNVVSQGGGDRPVVILHADGQGHFYADGSVNGYPLRFIVDTGATVVSLGAADARRLGLDPAKGQLGVTQTANGQTVVSRIRLDTVKVGDIVLHNVDALIHQNEMPVALLGMSFLNRLEMQREGDTMTLRKRY